MRSVDVAAVPGLNYRYDDGDHQRWKVAATWKGQTLKEWVRRALNKVAAEEEAEREERRRRLGR